MLVWRSECLSDLPPLPGLRGSTPCCYGALTPKPQSVAVQTGLRTTVTPSSKAVQYVNEMIGSEYIAGQVPPWSSVVSQRCSQFRTYTLHYPRTPVPNTVHSTLPGWQRSVKPLQPSPMAAPIISWSSSAPAASVPPPSSLSRSFSRTSSVTLYRRSSVQAFVSSLLHSSWVR